ncbi:hypothetical protein DMC47_41270 [Nostoc sp. 3335mG]|nr:hypothetical protein DMC47_41270 [Nostoc sp. 3335mG]
MSGPSPASIPGIRGHWLVGKAGRYVLATIGPVSSAGTQFALSLAMLRLLTPDAFGSFTFLLVASQLSWGMWSALLCAPLPVLLAGPVAAERRSAEDTLLAANLIGAASSFVPFVAMAIALRMSPAAAICYGAYGALALIRWFGRAYCYALGQQTRTIASDLVYSVTVLATLSGVVILNGDIGVGCYAALLAGTLAGISPFGATMIRRQMQAISLRSLCGYRPIWRGHARWAMLGVLTTEATANAHVYLITLLKGPAAFAPIAASALLLRPVNVAQNALSDFERPQMATLIAGQRIREVLRSLTAFRLALAAIWLGTVGIAVSVFAIDPHLLFPPAYDASFLAIAACLWAIVAALRLVQIPESTLLQAVGAFRPLAMASLWSSIGSIATVFLLILAAGPLWSIVGIIAGAAVYWHWTRRFAKRWLHTFAEEVAP